MYTQCPQCQTAFRVTARVLQQAADKVRCGGCSHAFNALDYLSEELPVARDDALEKEEKSESKKLLDTLNELAGPDNVVIEDTGAEWQVLDDTEGDQDASRDPTAETGTLRWMLEDVEDPSEAVPEIVDEVSLDDASATSGRSAEKVMRFDDNTPLPDDFDDGVTVSPNSPQRRRQDRIELESRHFDEMQIDLALGEPEEWVDLLDEVDDVSGDADGGIPIEVEEELAAIHNELSSRPVTEWAGPERRSKGPAPPSDVESQFDSQAEALGLEASGSHDLESEAAGDGGVEHWPDDSHAGGLETTGEFEKQIEAARAALAGIDAEERAEDEIETGEYPQAVESTKAATGGSEEGQDEDDIAELVLRGELKAAEVAEPESDELVLAEDHELSDSGSSHQDQAKPSRTSRYPDHLFDENAENVETIIMEGEFVRGSWQDEQQESTGKNEELEDAAFLADTYSINRNTVRGGRRRTDPAGFGTISAVLLLTLVLAGQVVHHFREALSTIGAFNQTIAPLYRLAGEPITPEWNIQGWQFQTTRGATDENEQLLTIYSTIVNRSSQPLPYPLVHVSLTDRWEEIMGSRVLEPNEYLAGDLDPSTLVAAGEKFTAVISINDPSPDATGFKLNVCYRVAPGQVRCATEDFRE